MLGCVSRPAVHTRHDALQGEVWGRQDAFRCLLRYTKDCHRKQVLRRTGAKHV